MENQESADARLPYFAQLPIPHKNIICQPLIGPIEIAQYLDDVELVVVGGESDRLARPLDYGWVLSIRDQCIRMGSTASFDSAALILSKMENLHASSKGIVSSGEESGHKLLDTGMDTSLDQLSIQMG